MTYHFKSRISSIPCLIQVDHYAPSEPAKLSGPPDSWYEGSPEEFEFTVLDWRGRPAPWLERKLTPADGARLLSEYKNEEVRYG